MTPFERLQAWIGEAEAAGAREPHAMCLATATPDGVPSARMVLLRGLDERGLRFYTSYFSRKGRELADNPRAAAVFHWPQIERQVRVEGGVAELAEDESDAYFAARPRGHQLAAWASEQSENLEDPALLRERFEHFAERFDGEDVPRPHSWGGYRIVPERFEFWSGRPDRLHDREAYVRDAGLWVPHRLQP